VITGVANQIHVDGMSPLHFYMLPITGSSAHSSLIS
jgi:hypothetical protein